ncbi:ABC transporter ATP-binding protein [Vallitalea guaymasensis]|uniref:ABC transporter ATP-binding protein n=1 Tax=Vallitalea guaymasensis TaxID=1185412 RepID=UPI002353C621|nr:ABC transporter ATP-binding protein [Vallitalea guaymasensis]
MFRLIKRILALSGKKRKDLYIANFFQLIQATCEGIVYIIIYLAITHLVSGTFDKTILLQYFLSLLIVISLRYIFSYQVNRLQASAGYEIMRDIRIDETKKLNNLPLGVFQSRGIGKLSSTFTTDMTFIEMHCMYAISRYVAGMSIIIMTTIIMLIVDWRLTLLAVSGFVPGFLVYRNSKKKLLINGQIRHESQQKCISALIEYLNGLETIRSYHMTDRIFSNIFDKLNKYKDASSRYEIQAIKPMALYQILIRIGMGMIFIGGLALYVNNIVSLEVFIFFAVISTLYYQPIESIFHDYGTLNIMGVALDHLDELKKEKPLDNQGSKNIRNSNIEGNRINFCYPKSEKNAIEGINFRMEPKTLNAIVGHSGSGKTTMLYLISRFFDIDSGEIMIDKHNVKDIEYGNLLKNISVVFQDSYLLEDTIFNNIKMGSEDATHDEVIEAAKAACCHDFIIELEKGYDTVVGEGGNTLSGGEKQRITIARAILKDVPIVLLDEAMASIDPENSWQIKKAIDALTRDKTVILIAHTLGYIKYADQIIVMENGRIEEHGKHDYLIERNGIYKKMWDIQQTTKEWKAIN